MQPDQQTSVVTPTDEFVSFFASKLRPTIIGAMEALAILQRGTCRKHKLHPADPDAFSITVKSLERVIRKCYVAPFLDLSCTLLSKSYQAGVSTRAWRLREGFNVEEAYLRLGRILEEKSAGRSRPWRQKKAPTQKAEETANQLPSSPSGSFVSRTNAFTIRPGMKWYDSAIIAAFPGSITYRRAARSTGRRYHPLQNVSSEGKALALGGTGLMDIDISRCHPAILQHLMGGRSLALREYLSMATRPAELKEDINAIIHGRRRARTPLGEKLILEMPIIRKRLGLSPSHGRRGMFDLLTVHEDHALAAIESALRRLGRCAVLLMFDGVICEPISQTHLLWIQGEVALVTGMFLHLEVKRIY